MLQDTLDHKTLVAEDDPHLAKFEELHTLGLIDMVKVEATGCEKLAEMVGICAQQWLIDAGYSPRVQLVSAKVWEHDKNSATWTPEFSDAYDYYGDYI
jgi:hypothetical protein